MKCADCKGKGKYEPLLGPAEPCRQCRGTGQTADPDEYLGGPAGVPYMSRDGNSRVGDFSDPVFFRPHGMALLDQLTVVLHANHPAVMSGQFRAGFYQALNRNQAPFLVRVDLGNQMVYVDPASLTSYP